MKSAADILTSSSEQTRAIEQHDGGSEDRDPKQRPLPMQPRAGVSPRGARDDYDLLPEWLEGDLYPASIVGRAQSPLSALLCAWYSGVTAF